MGARKVCNIYFETLVERGLDVFKGVCPLCNVAVGFHLHTPQGESPVCRNVVLVAPRPAPPPGERNNVDLRSDVRLLLYYCCAR
jgi:hypothetical protein